TPGTTRVRVANRGARARDRRGGVVFHPARGEADPADRPGHQPARAKWLFETDRGKGPDRSRETGTPARVAARALAGAGPGKEPFLEAHVARTQDAACKHSRRNRTAARRYRRRTGRVTARGDRYPAAERPETAAADRKPVELQRLANEERGADPVAVFTARADRFRGKSAAPGVEKRADPAATPGRGLCHHGGSGD